MTGRAILGTRLLLILAVCLTFLIGCSSDDPGRDILTPSDGNEADDNEADDNGPDDEQFSLLPAGPADPGTPVGNAWYLSLSRGECEEVLEQANGANPNDAPVILYRAAAQACLGQWDAAETDFDLYLQFEPELSSDPCHGRTRVVEWARRLLEAHRQDPSFSPTFVRGEAIGECLPSPTISPTPTETLPEPESPSPSPT